MSLVERDPEIFKLIQEESERQNNGLELIASENFTSKAVMETLGTCLTNKYSEGQVGARYYGGNKVIDRVESLCKNRALETFNLNPEEWAVNVQALSGTGANLAAYCAILDVGDKIMGLDLPCGGHLSHGYQTKTKKISQVSIFFETQGYGLDAETQLIDYDAMEKQALEFKPKLIIAGASAYPRDWDYKKIRTICDSIGAYMMADIAHISGLVATKEQNNPFEYCDIVTTTTHKTLRGPRSGLIFSKKEFEQRIDFAVFPRLNGGPHNHQIAAVAVALKEAQTEDYRNYCRQIKKNCTTLANYLINHGYTLMTSGTDNHLILWTLKPQGLSGSKFEKICDRVNITLNKNTVYGDKSAFSPSGVRMGTPALTTRGLTETDFVKVGEFLHRLVKLSQQIMETCETKKLSEFITKMELFNKDLDAIQKEVVDFSSKFKDINDLSTH